MTDQPEMNTQPTPTPDQQPPQQEAEVVEEANQQAVDLTPEQIQELAQELIDGLHADMENEVGEEEVSAEEQEAGGRPPDANQQAGT